MSFGPDRKRSPFGECILILITTENCHAYILRQWSEQISRCYYKMPADVILAIALNGNVPMLLTQGGTAEKV